MSAVLRAIFRLCPAAKEHIAQRAQTWLDPASRPGGQPSLNLVGNEAGLRVLREQRCIDFYFEHVHAITPIINEEDFRATYASGNRRDAPWLGLLNMVFALGSIASGSDLLHEQYYQQARSSVDLDSLGFGNLESFQTLCLLGGYYLHYRNSPNMAYAILGAAHRVAIALGLHRESRRRGSNVSDAHVEQAQRVRTETRRRAWWSLFCLDTWASMTLGRPTCGRWEMDTMNTFLPSSLEPGDHVADSLRASSQFCLICDRIQRQFAGFSRLTAADILAYDEELQGWYGALPRVLTQGTSSPPRLNVAREFMRNRYLNVRLILSRSLLLYLAHDHVKQTDLSVEEQRIVDNCRAIACEAIDSIALHWTPNRVQVWNSAWYLFQACTVPLLSIAVESGSKASCGPESVASWRSSLAKALETFIEMKPWMRAIDRAPDIVNALYEAVNSEADGPIRTPSVTDGGLDLFGWCDEQLMELDWGVHLSDDSLPQGMFALS